MATKLTNNYQFIGRSSPVPSPAGRNYYVLVYAKTVGDISTGKHNVSIQMRLACPDDSSFYGYRTTAYAKADGVTAIQWDSQKIPGNNWGDSPKLSVGGVTYKRWVTIGEGTAEVNTGFGVEKTVQIECSWVMNAKESMGWFPVAGTYAKASIDVTLPMIAGASTITAVSNAILGGNSNIKWVPASVDFRFRLEFSIGGWKHTTGVIHPNKTTDYTYTGAIPLDAARQLPDDPTGTMNVVLYTYADSGATKQIGTADSKTFTVTVPDNGDTQPAVQMDLTLVSNLPAVFDGLYIQGKTKVRATLSAEGKYGATIGSYSMHVGGVSYGPDKGYTSGHLADPGSLTVYGYAEDSRGYTGSASEDITVIGYGSPKIVDVEAKRCDSTGKLSDSGTYLKIKAKRSYTPIVVGGEQKNFCQIRFRFKAASATRYSEWNTILARDSLESDEVITNALLGGALAANHSYVVQVQAVDDVGDYADTTITVPTDVVHTHKTKNGLGLGKYCEGENLLDVAWDAHFHGDVMVGDMTLRKYILSVIEGG